MYKHLHSTGTEKTFPLGSISKLETPIINTTMMQYHAVDRIVILLKNPNPVIYTSSRSQKSSEKSQYARTHQPPPLRSACVRTHLFCVYEESTHVNIKNFLNRVAWNSVIKLRRNFSFNKSGYLSSFIPCGL